MIPLPNTQINETAMPLTSYWIFLGLALCWMHAFNLLIQPKRSKSSLVPYCNSYFSSIYSMGVMATVIRKFQYSTQTSCINLLSTPALPLFTRPHCYTSMPTATKSIQYTLHDKAPPSSCGIYLGMVIHRIYSMGRP